MGFIVLFERNAEEEVGDADQEVTWTITHEHAHDICNNEKRSEG